MVWKITEYEAFFLTLAKKESSKTCLFMYVLCFSAQEENNCKQMGFWQSLLHIFLTLT